MTAAAILSMGPAPSADLPEIFLTPAEHDQLSRLVGDHEATGVAGLLQQELDRATVVEDRPAHAVGLDRWVHYSDGRAGDLRRVKVVLPQAADIDAGLISAAQAVEHYEMTRYGTLVEWAKQLGRSDCAAVLQKNLDEEKATDKKLTQLAESKVNLQAAE